MAKKTKSTNPVASAPVKSAPAATPVIEPAVMAEAEPKSSVIIWPIWKDFIKTFNTNMNVKYKLRLEKTKEVIFSGEAVASPTGSTQVKVNGIVANYLRQRNLQHNTDQDEVFQEVSIEENGSGTWTPLAIFRLDWSYDMDSNFNGIYSKPITGRISPGQPLVFSASVEGKFVWEYIKKDGTVEVFEDTCTRGVMKNIWDYVPITSQVKEIVINYGIHLQVTEGCEDYAIYYVNSVGGWDAFLIEGRTIRRDGIARKAFKKEYNNTSSFDFGRVNYQNDITREYEIHTGLMTGESGQKMHNLLETNMAYLFDIANFRYYPIIITDSICEFKTYGSNGNKLYEYTINAEVARDFVRK